MAHHTCPIWIGYLLLSPLRKFLENPEKIFKPHIKNGMNILDIGSAMGFFSLPLAKLVSPDGKVFCVDLQQKMLDSLLKRADKAGVSDSIETILADENTLNIKNMEGTIDAAVAYHVLHEVNDQESFLTETFKALKKNGKLFLSEPWWHVSKTDFDKSTELALKVGFKRCDGQNKRQRNSVVLEKK